MPCVDLELHCIVCCMGSSHAALCHDVDHDGKTMSCNVMTVVRVQSMLLTAALCHDVNHDGKILSCTSLLVIRVYACCVIVSTLPKLSLQKCYFGFHISRGFPKGVTFPSGKPLCLADPGFCIVALALCCPLLLEGSSQHLAV